MKKIYLFEAKNEVQEIKRTLIKMEKRGQIEKREMSNIVNEFSDKKRNVAEGQKFISISV